MITYYRLRFKNGDVGKWSKDLAHIEKCAAFFNATIEKWTTNYEYEDYEYFSIY